MRTRTAFVAFGVMTFAATVSHPVDAAPCPRMGMAPQVVTKADSTVPADGGVLVRWVSARISEGATMTEPTWTVKQGKRTLKVISTVLAPGLVRYSADGGGAQQLVDENGKLLLPYTRATTKDSDGLAKAPDVKAIEMIENDRPRYSSRTFTAKLNAAVPANAVAVIVYGYDAKTKADTALRWTNVTKGDTTITLDSQGRSCGGVAMGTVALQRDNKLSLAWVDATGRVSAHSNVVSVVEVADVPRPGVPRPE